MALRPQVPDWEVSPDALLLSREYQCRDFAEALAFLEQVGALSEAEGHHPDLHLTAYRHLRIELSTHAIGGLSQNDFILAAKIDRLRSW
jgi:4a-hydroxytetrahydrobiopterin dehydratase